MFNFIILIFIYTAIYSLLAMGQNVITGYTGMLSLCQAGFFAIGSYATALLSVKCGWNFWATLPVSIGLSALFGLLIGLPTLRLKGDYLCIATLGFGEIVRNILINWMSLTNGPNGVQRIPMVKIFGFAINPRSRNWQYLIFCVIWVLVCYLLFERLARSRMGRAMEAIREDEIAAASNGINVTKYKVAAFMLGAGVAGLAGSLQAELILSVMPSTYTFMLSVMVLCVVVLGGMGNFKAVIFGAFIIEVIDYLPKMLGLTSVLPPQFKQILFGLILVVMMICRPQGILGRQNNAFKRPREAAK